MTVSDVAIALGESWKVLASDEKDGYHSSAKEDRERYAKEMASFKLSGKAAIQEDEEEYSDED